MVSVSIDSARPLFELAQGSDVTVRLPGKPRRYYWHGWQSWSLAAWVDAARLLPSSQPHLLHPMQIDPAYAFRPRPHGSWLGAVSLDDGNIVLLGSLGLDAHVELEGKALKGICEAGSVEWFIGYGDERQVFGRYAEELAARFGRRAATKAPRVWCSWYSLYTAIDEQRIERVLSGVADLPFDVLQVDDGWQQAVGDWEPNHKFPAGMQTMAHRIRATGRRAGIWLAPLLAVEDSSLFREHPDWFLRDARGRLVSAGFNWGQRLRALDTTHPLVMQWLKALMQKTRAWGFDYLKLDFLYAGALPGVRHADISREQAYRASISLLREAMGEDAFFLACGAPILPSLGLCDALRIGPDVAPQWELVQDAVLLHNPAIPGVRNAIRTTLNRLWLQPLVLPDPDVVYFRSRQCNLSHEQRLLLQNLALICDFRATSDPPQWLSEHELLALRQFLTDDPLIEQLEPRRFRIHNQVVDFAPVLELPRAAAGWLAFQSRLLAWLANHTWALRIYDRMGRRRLARRLHEEDALWTPERDIQD